MIRRVRRALADLGRRPGLTPAQERWFDRAAVAVVSLFAIGWAGAIFVSIAEGVPPRPTGRVTASPFSRDAPPEAAFLLDAAVRRLAADRLYGESGAVRVVVRPPGDSLPLADSLPPGVELEYAPAEPEGEAGEPGIWNVILRMRDEIRRVPGLTVLTLTPLSELRGGRIGEYRIGQWPGRSERRGRFRAPAYDPPAGLVRVTPRNQNLRISEHFRLRDFLTKGQEDVWPKYVALSPRLLDKLELTLQQLEADGHPVENVGVISGFRTPYYNEHGGSTAGRGALSRHMYGDAMDFYIDNDRDGRMDDLNGDGRVGIEDARVLAGAADAVERERPRLVGGIGTYRPVPGAHAGFVHVDTRGYRARW